MAQVVDNPPNIGYYLIKTDIRGVVYGKTVEKEKIYGVYIA